MSSRSWASSGRRPARDRAAGGRPAGSFAVALARARDAWDGLTGGPGVPFGPDIEAGHVVALGPGDDPGVRLVYSDAAAAAILALALGLWPDTAASMSDGSGDDEGD